MLHKILLSSFNFILIGFFFFVISLPNVYALGYGEGKYGSGTYNDGETFPTPTSAAGQSNSIVSIINNIFSSPAPQTCSAQQPSSAPNLYQIDAFMSSATLYVVPPGQPYTGIQILYGFSQGDHRYSTNVSVQNVTGAISTTINFLAPNTTYYFTVKGINDCVGGENSNTVLAKTGWVPFRKNTSYAKTKTTQSTTLTSQTKVNSQKEPNSTIPSSTENKNGESKNNTTFEKSPPSQPNLFQSVVGWVKRLFGK